MSEFKKYSNIHVNYKIWVNAEDGTSILGDDKFLLLKTIKEEGSLKMASVKLKISYRKAWGDLKACEEMLGFSLIDKHRGGADGGSTKLTDEGVRFIVLYEDMQNDFQLAVSDIIKIFKKNLKS
ncbi:MAG: LysR family transcriptional regulator [Bacteroidota bacterium]